MSAIANLLRDHQAILKVLAHAEQEAQRMPWLGKVPVDALRELLDFFRQFVVHYHHLKEETGLFATLWQASPEAVGGIIENLIAEHAEGDHLLCALDRDLQLISEDHWQAARALAQTLQAYVTLMRAHIQKENDAVYPLADQLLKPEDHDALNQIFERLERDEIGQTARQATRHSPLLLLETNPSVPSNPKPPGG